MQAIIQQRVQEITGKPRTDITITERPRTDYQSNDLYDIRFNDTHWLAKVFVKVDEFSTSPMREFQSLKLLEPLDIAPKPIDLLPYPDYENPIVLYQFMAGQMWDRRKPSAHDLAQLAEIWLQIYTLTRDELWESRTLHPKVTANLERYHANFRQYAQWSEANFPSAAEIVKRLDALYQERRVLAQSLDARHMTRLFSKSDPRFANVISRPDGRIGMIDWEDAGLRSPMRTISDLLLHANQEDLLTREEWSAFLNPFYENYPIPADNPRELLRLYQGITPLAWLGMLLSSIVRRIENGTFEQTLQINGMSYTQRLQRYLTHALAWESEDFEEKRAACENIYFFPQD